MLRATAIVRRLAVKADQIVDTIALDHEGRHRRRIALKGDKGTEFLLDLDKVAAIKSGDAFKLEDGRLIQVVAAPQDLLEVRAETPARLAKIAWHIGNRHTPAEIGDDAIYIGHDHVLAEMVRGLGGAVKRVTRPFEPERGAYEGHGHGHAHDHGAHDHLQIAPVGHSHQGHAEHDHDHGHACGCGHDHGHDHGHHHGHDHDHGHHHGHDHDRKR